MLLPNLHFALFTFEPGLHKRTSSKANTSAAALFLNFFYFFGHVALHF